MGLHNHTLIQIDTIILIRLLRMVRMYRVGVIAADHEAGSHCAAQFFRRFPQAVIDPIQHILKERRSGALFRIRSHFLIVKAGKHIDRALVSPFQESGKRCVSALQVIQMRR